MPPCAAAWSPRRPLDQEWTGEEELALFDVLLQDEEKRRLPGSELSKPAGELLAAVKARLTELDRFCEKEQTKGEVETHILDHVYTSLLTPPFTDDEISLIAANVCFDV